MQDESCRHHPGCSESPDGAGLLHRSILSGQMRRLTVGPGAAHKVAIMFTLHRQRRAALLVTATLLMASSLQATNGMLMTSYGTRYMGMGGATLAIGGSVMDLESNPSNLTRLDDAIFEAGLSLMAPQLTYRDKFYPGNTDLSYNNSVRSEPSLFPLPYIGYAAPINDRMAWGVSFYAQGGMGAEFDGILRTTPNGGTLNQLFQGLAGDPTLTLPLIGDLRQIRERTYSNLAFVKTTFGLSYQLTNALHVGVGVDVGAAQMKWEWTFKDPGGFMTMPGAGYRYESDTAYGMAGKVGLVYEITENWAASYAYTGRTNLRFDGKMSVNEGDPRYFLKPTVSMNMGYPDKHGVGVAYDNKKGLIVGLTYSRINWASVMNTIEFDLSAPYVTMPGGLVTNRLAFNMKWRDQNVYAVGVEYRPDTVAYRIGYNYGTNPVTSAGVNPLFPAITTHHASLGLGLRFDRLDVDFAVEHAFLSTVKGDTMSDWTVLHALYSFDANGIKNPYMNYEVSMQQTIFSIGIKHRSE